MQILFNLSVVLNFTLSPMSSLPENKLYGGKSEIKLAVMFDLQDIINLLENSPNIIEYPERLRFMLMNKMSFTNRHVSSE